MNKKSAAGGLLLVIIGIFLILTDVNFPADSSQTLFDVYWPSVTVLFAGVLLHLFYLLTHWNGSQYLLIPAGVLITLGGLFQTAVLYNAWNYVWPGFILAPAVGLLEFYWMGGKPKWALIPITILSTISIVIFLVFIANKFLTIQTLQWVLATLFILCGFILIFGKSRNTLNQ